VCEGEDICHSNVKCEEKELDLWRKNLPSEREPSIGTDPKGGAAPITLGNGITRISGNGALFNQSMRRDD